MDINKDLNIAKSRFTQITGTQYQHSYNLEQFMIETDFILENIISETFINNYQSILALNLLNQAKAQNKIEKSNYFPSANLFYTYNKSRGRYSYFTNDDSSNSDVVYGVKINVPIFTSFTTTSEVISSQDKVLQQEYSYNSLKNNITQELTKLIEMLNVFNELKKEHKSYVEYAEKSYEAIKKQYEAKLKDITYLLDAQNTLLDARSKLNETNAKILKNYFAIIFLTGKLNEDFFSQ